MTKEQAMIIQGQIGLIPRFLRDMGEEAKYGNDEGVREEIHAMLGVLGTIASRAGMTRRDADHTMSVSWPS